jgi:hypothetical protein
MLDAGGNIGVTVCEADEAWDHGAGPSRLEWLAG